jgi:hypothetical protein
MTQCIIVDAELLCRKRTYRGVRRLRALDFQVERRSDPILVSMSQLGVEAGMSVDLSGQF